MKEYEWLFTEETYHVCRICVAPIGDRSVHYTWHLNKGDILKRKDSNSVSNQN